MADRLGGFSDNITNSAQLWSGLGLRLTKREMTNVDQNVTINLFSTLTNKPIWSIHPRCGWAWPNSPQLVFFTFSINSFYSEYQNIKEYCPRVIWILHHFFSFWLWLISKILLITNDLWKVFANEISYSKSWYYKYGLKFRSVLIYNLPFV